eukprot:2704590-Pyramimonas_sp.AAC.1
MVRHCQTAQETGTETDRKDIIERVWKSGCWKRSFDFMWDVMKFMFFLANFLVSGLVMKPVVTGAVAGFMDAVTNAVPTWTWRIPRTEPQMPIFWIRARLITRVMQISPLTSKWSRVAA